METHSFFSHHLGDTLLPLFVVYSRHTTSSSHDLSDTRIPPDSWGTVVAAWRHTQQAFLTHREFILLHLHWRPMPPLVNCHLVALLAVHLTAHLAHNPVVLLGSAWLFLTLGLVIRITLTDPSLLLWLVCRQGLRLLLLSMHFFTDGGVAVSSLVI